jgi:light-regulated signal transduction histidine kinase (bacteriophytochrome)
MHILDVLPEHLKEKVMMEVVPTLMDKGIWEGELQFRNLMTGSLVDVHAMSFTIKDPKTNLPLYLANVSLDITEWKKAQSSLAEHASKLERLNQELHERNRELDEFTHVASHDLQEPLRKLTAFAGLIRKDIGENLPEVANKDLNYITDAASRMQNLIKDLLAFSRSGRAEMNREEISLDKCVDEALEALDARIQDTHAEIYRDRLPAVWGDYRMITQLYQNLIGNALKFVREGPPLVCLTAEEVDGQWVLGVQDNGIGINPQYAEQIFVPFKRLHTQSDYEGTGVGLAICKKVIERHNGKIWVESELGKGAHFKFMMPKRKEDKVKNDEE